MSKAAYFLIDGFEETEGVAPIDILRRGGVQVQIVSLNGESKMVTGKHGIVFQAEATLADWDEDVDILITPGGTIAYLDHEDYLNALREAEQKGRRLAAICAAPAVFGKLGFVQGKKAVIYPGMESYLEGAELADAPVITDGNITTGKGPGLSIAFGLELLTLLEGKEAADRVKADFLA